MFLSGLAFLRLHLLLQFSNLPRKNSKSRPRPALSSPTVINYLGQIDFFLLVSDVDVSSFWIFSFLWELKIMLWLCKSEKLNTLWVPFDNCFSFLIAVSAFGESQNFATVGPVFGLRKYCLFWLTIFYCVCIKKIYTKHSKRREQFYTRQYIILSLNNATHVHLALWNLYNFIPWSTNVMVKTPLIWSTAWTKNWFVM